METKNSQLLEFTYLTRIEKSIVNANQNEGNIIVLKKSQDIDGPHIFISGTCLKYAIKENFKEQGKPISKVLNKTSDSTITSEGDPQKNWDDDLFGYMLTKSSKTKSNKPIKGKTVVRSTLLRVAPVKTNGMFSIFPYSGDINIGVRYSDDKKDNALFNVEIDTNIFRSNWAIELSRIGTGEDFSLSSEEKNKRINGLLAGLFEMHGGGHQSNYLTNLQPKLLIAIKREGACPVVLDSLTLNKKKEIDIELLVESLRLHKNAIKKIWLGAVPNFALNFEEMSKAIEKYCKENKIEIVLGKMSEIKTDLIETKWHG